MEVSSLKKKKVNLYRTITHSSMRLTVQVTTAGDA